MTIEKMIFTHRHDASIGLFPFCWLCDAGDDVRLINQYMVWGRHLHCSEITACVLYGLIRNLFLVCLSASQILVGKLFECLCASQLIKKKILCYSQDNRLLLLKLVRHKKSWSNYSQPVKFRWQRCQKTFNITLILRNKLLIFLNLDMLTARRGLMQQQSAFAGYQSYWLLTGTRAAHSNQISTHWVPFLLYLRLAAKYVVLQSNYTCFRFLKTRFTLYCSASTFIMASNGHIKLNLKLWNFHQTAQLKCFERISYLPSYCLAYQRIEPVISMEIPNIQPCVTNETIGHAKTNSRVSL